jgi:hypothetical protein
VDSENSGQEVWVSKSLLSSQSIRAQKVIESGISWQNKDLLLSLWESCKRENTKNQALSTVQSIARCVSSRKKTRTDLSIPNDSENGLQCVELTSIGQSVLGIWAQRGNCIVHRYCTGTLHRHGSCRHKGINTSWPHPFKRTPLFYIISNINTIATRRYPKASKRGSRQQLLQHQHPTV